LPNAGSERFVYAIALGSNRRHHRHGAPGAVIEAAIAKLGGKVVARSAIRETAPLGPSKRRYANAAILLRSRRNPANMLAKLKSIEAAFGQRRGQRWAARTLDLDIILWSGGIHAARGLSIPHPAFRTRAFVLDPLAGIAPRWRDPLSGLTIRHLKARLDRPRARA
jgi:2-amino-4-hydroxy-6-hydroxymethyldihydropteridine diphosphokinase